MLTLIAADCGSARRFARSANRCNGCRRTVAGWHSTRLSRTAGRGVGRRSGARRTRQAATLAVVPFEALTGLLRVPLGLVEWAYRWLLCSCPSRSTRSSQPRGWLHSSALTQSSPIRTRHSLTIRSGGGSVGHGGAAARPIRSRGPTGTDAATSAENFCRGNTPAARRSMQGSASRPAAWAACRPVGTEGTACQGLGSRRVARVDRDAARRSSHRRSRTVPSRACSP